MGIFRLAGLGRRESATQLKYVRKNKQLSVDGRLLDGAPPDLRGAGRSAFDAGVCRYAESGCGTPPAANQGAGTQ